MCVEIEQAGQDILIVRERDDSRVAEIAPVKVGIDFQELAVADDDARIAANAFVDRVEQPTAAHDDVAGSDLRLNLPEESCGGTRPRATPWSWCGENGSS